MVSNDLTQGKNKKKINKAAMKKKVTAHKVCLDGMEIRRKKSNIGLLSRKHVFRDIASFAACPT